MLERVFRQTTRPLFAAILLLFAFALAIGQNKKPAVHPPAAPSKPDFAQIDDYVRSQMELGRIPGASLAIVQGNQIVHRRGFGVADAHGHNMTPQTPCQIGSLSKSFTALAIMQLKEEGKIRLDAPVRRYLPWFQTADPNASAQITVRHLLNQTSGLSGYSGTVGLNDDIADSGALERRVRALSSARLSHPVGKQFEDSYANYDILGMIVQAVSKQPYEQYVQRHIFAPLAMRHSYCLLAKAKQHGLATGHRYWFGFPVAESHLPYPGGHKPAGGLISCAEDMGHYLIAQMNGGRYQNQTLLSPQDMGEMHRPSARMDAQNRYGMGWIVGDLDGVPVVRYSGGTPDFHADMVMVPHKKWGIVLLMTANAHWANERIEGMVSGVTSLLVGQEPPTFAVNSFDLILIVVAIMLPIFQIFFLGQMFYLLRQRTRRSSSSLPSGPTPQRILASIAINMTLLFLLLVILPRRYQVTLPVLILYAPDAGTLMLVSTVLAICGLGLAFMALLRTRRA